MAKKIYSGLIVLVLFLAFQGYAKAENVTLKSGKVFTGEILSHSTSEVEIYTDTGVTQIPYRMIRKVELEENQDQPYPMLEDIQKKVTVIQSKDKRTNRLHANSSKGKRRKLGKKVELYMTNWCPYCQKMERYLRSIGANYVSYNIERDSAANRRYKKMRGRGVPVVKIGSKVIHGYNTRAVNKALR